MRILLVFCHPAPESFQRSILDALAARLTGAGHALTVIDLYAEGFEPVLDAESWRAHRRGEAHEAPDLDRHIAALRAAEGLILVYPTWWYGLPAMLKGWFDRVWRPGVAFAIENGVFKTGYLANIRRIAVVTTCGSPRWLIQWMVGDPARRQVMRGLALQFAKGVKRRWLAIYGVDGRTEPDLARARERAVGNLAAWFGR